MTDKARITELEIALSDARMWEAAYKTTATRLQAELLAHGRPAVVEGTQNLGRATYAARQLAELRARVAALEAANDLLLGRALNAEALLGAQTGKLAGYVWPEEVPLATAE